ncbi:tRNA (guanosine(46)-N7)-methyltransferase TrmB [Lentibacillus sp. Marseille-P4043]|uniref:tRNA (guanosine(46)-N7)-methyltransferase TrmB n=1 Tax=Lentibacillus sp. Marseille-P4043 TaxID=2040293 RepID=UPI000D0BC55E|nr:tRNA (guanosine(46)-N7)-methyltransferase TrmB [Lentibacillus sp. Marseille-P4043]
MRQRHKPWADDFLAKNNQLVKANPMNHKANWQAVFGNENPIHLEIGTGKGRFLVGMAEQYPDVNFIGIELSKSVIVTAAQKIIDSELDNILLVNMDADKLCDVFAGDEVSTIYLNFSDPWPKNRHEKRRLSFHTFLEKYRTILNSTGEVVLKTDNRGLFEYSLVSFSAFGMKLEDVSLDLHQLQDPTNVMTEYEQKFSEKGHVIYRCRASFIG